MKKDMFLKGLAFIALAAVICISGRLAADSELDPKKTAQNGYLSINTVPHTEVYIEGESVGTTPVLKYSLEVGKHQVRLVSSANDVDIKISVVIQSNQVTKIVKNIKHPVPPPKKKGTLSVNSDPPTTVYIDDKKIGSTPHIKIPLKPGKHEIVMINLEYDIHHKEKITIKAGRHKKIVKNFEKKQTDGTLSVASSPHTTVYVDGNKIGHTPISSYRLEPGNYKVDLVNDDMNIHYTTTATIIKGKKTKISKTFKKATSEQGTLSVITQPPTTVYVDGKKAGNTPIKKHGLTPGMHEVNLVNWKHYIHDTITVHIKKGKNTKISKNYEKLED